MWTAFVVLEAAVLRAMNIVLHTTLVVVMIRRNIIHIRSILKLLSLQEGHLMRLVLCSRMRMSPETP